MNAVDDLMLLVEDMAGHWTEPALAILKAAGIRDVSVALEIATWQALKKGLRSELRWRRAFPLWPLVPLSTLKEEVLRRALVVAARQVEPRAVTSALKTAIRRGARKQRTTAAERRLYGAMMGQPALPVGLELADGAEIRVAAVDRESVPALE